MLYDPELPIVGDRRGGSASNKALRRAVAALNAVRSLALKAEPFPTDEAIGPIALGRGHASLMEEGSMIIMTTGHEDHDPVMVRLPYVDSSDRGELVARICDIAVRTVEASLRRNQKALHQAVLDRNDAVCAAIALSTGVNAGDVRLRPASPFARARATIVRGSTTATWSVGAEHVHWINALFVAYTAYEVPNGSVHLHLDQLVDHSGPKSCDTMDVLRLLADLPAGPPVVIAETAWGPLF
jgi:hypothetical protein